MPRNEKRGKHEERLLRRLIRGEPLAPALRYCGTEEVSRLAVSHKVLSPLAHRVLEEGRADAVWRLWAAAAALAMERDARLISKALRKTVDLLEEAGISPIVLKGFSLAQGRPRDAGDVDLLIPEASLTSAIETLEKAGYRYRGFERNMRIRRSEYRNWGKLSRWSIQFEFEETETGALVELHTAFFETARVYSEDLGALRRSIGEFAAASVVDAGTGYRVLSPEDRVLLLALHAGLKRSPDNRNFSARHILDLQSMIDMGLDWERLRLRAGRFGVTHHLLLLLWLFEALAGPGIPQGYLERVNAGLPPRVVRLQELHLRCMKGLGSYDRWAILAYKFLSPFVLHGTTGARIGSLLILPLLLPPPYELERIYGLPPRSRLTCFLYLLEPLRCLYRLSRKTVRMMSAP